MIIKELKSPVASNYSLPLFHFRDRFGDVSVHKFDDIIISQFSGPCGAGIVKQYTHALEQVFNQYENKPWAYLTISSGFEAATEEAIDALTRSFSQGLKKGCVAEAYIIGSAMGREQIKSLREHFKMKTQFSDVLFESFNEAFMYLTNLLDDYSINTAQKAQR